MKSAREKMPKRVRDAECGVGRVDVLVRYWAYVERCVSNTLIVWKETPHIAVHYADLLPEFTFHNLVVCLWIASKYHETFPLEIRDFRKLLNMSRADIKLLEANILHALEFRLERPTYIRYVMEHAIPHTTQDLVGLMMSLTYKEFVAASETDRVAMLRYALPCACSDDDACDGFQTPSCTRARADDS